MSNQLNNKTVLMVGGAGFIGSWLAHYLKDEGAKVVVIDPVETSSGMDKETFESVVKFRKEKLLDEVFFFQRPFDEEAKHVFIDFKPDIVVHLAAKPLESPDNSVLAESQIFGDTKLTYDVIQMCNQYKVKHFIYMSSIFAHGDFKGYSVDEETGLDPTTPYGISKAVGEFYVKNFCRMPWNIIRTTSVYGFGDSNLRATQIFMTRAKNKKDFWVNELSWPDFIYIKDLVKGIIDVMTKEAYFEIFNISGGRMSPLEDFAKVVSSKFGVNYEAKQLDDRPRRGSLINDKARVLLDWKPFYNLETGVEDYMSTAKLYNHG